MPKRKKSELKMSREGKTARITVDGVIGWDYFGVTSKGFKQDLKENCLDANTIEVEIDSPGGVITEGISMANALMETEATVHTYVSGQAASMGSILLMSGDKMFIPSNALVMVHKPLNGFFGNADEMRKNADTLDQFETALVSMYMRHFKGSEEEMATLMKAETWLTATDMDEKFKDVVVMKNELQAVACAAPISEWTASKEIVDEEKPSFMSRFFNFLNGEGCTKEADALKAVLLTESNTNEEDIMTPKEQAEMEKSIAANVTTSVMAGLKEAGVIKAEKEEPKKGKVELEFKGDASKPEDVKAHVKALKMAQLEAAVDWSDVASVAAYQEKAFGKEAPSKGSSNAEDVKDSEDAVNEKKKKDSEDTFAFMQTFMPGNKGEGK